MIIIQDSEEIPQGFWQAVEEFNHQDFYACHDTLEALWMEARELHRNFYQGILQIAVALHHLSNLNWRGAVILMGEGIRRLDYYLPDYFEIDVEQFLSQTEELLQQLQQAGSEQIHEFVGSSESEKFKVKLPNLQRKKD